MNQKPPFILPKRNPATHSAHRRDVLRQITLPLVAGILLLVAAMAGVIWAATTSTPEVSRWADVSLMWLIIPALVFALFFLALLIGITYAITKLLGVLPPYASLIQDYFNIAYLKISQATEVIVMPFVKLNTWVTAARRGRQVFTEPLKPGKKPKQ